MTQEEIEHLARLSRVRLTNDEVKHFKHEISSILEYVSTVQTLAAEEPSTTGVSHHNIFRPDEVTNEPETHTETLLAAAPTRQGRFLSVKKILQLDE